MNHSIAIVAAKAGEVGAYKISELNKNPLFADKSELVCPKCGQMVSVPDGNFMNYTQRLSKELGNSHVYVRLTFHCQEKVNLPPGYVKKDRSELPPAEQTRLDKWVQELKNRG